MLTTGKAEPPLQVSVRSCERLILAGMFGTTDAGTVRSQVNAATLEPPAPLVAVKSPGAIKNGAAVARMAEYKPVELALTVLLPSGPVITNCDPVFRKVG